MTSKPRAVVAGATLLSLCALLFAVTAPHKIQWRLEVIQTKLGGRAPDWSWTRILAALVPGTAASGDVHLLMGAVYPVDRDDTSPCPVLWETPLGPLWAWELDRPYLSWHTVRWPRLQTLFPEPPRIPDDAVVLEVGAWVGTFVREALNRGARKVIALEPEPANFVCMQKNFASEIAAGQVVLVEAAAWSRDGSERFGHPEWDEYGEPQLGGEGFRAAQDGEVTVRTVKIDTLVEELGLDRIDLVEMDIEGAERHALRGARETLARYSPQIIVCEHHLADDAQAVPREIHAANDAYVRFSKEGHGYYRVPAAGHAAQTRQGLLP